MITDDRVFHDPFITDDINQSLMDDIRNEFSERAGRGDRAIFDFALEFSDAANHSLQSIGMSLMGMAVLSKDSEPLIKDDSLALWARCARIGFLTVLEKEVAPQWCRAEYERRGMENVEMVDSWRDLTPMAAGD